ncbi:MAG: hypothetical protein B6247_21570 [Candidatus Parabeggiatoa sp. nov. 2]|nr:MAG: hypothetical protein B6247_21570 [Beggiatoa sp. 4572_84]
MCLATDFAATVWLSFVANWQRGTRPSARKQSHHAPLRVKNPHEILREVERVLIPEGHVVILGFNPVSLWGIWRWFFARRETAPWCGRFLPLLRIKDWLALLGFDLKKQQTFFFALPFHSDRFKNYTKSVEKVGSRWAGNFGAAYVVVAKKRIATLTPIKSRWLTQPTLVTEAVSTHFANEE